MSVARRFSAAALVLGGLLAVAGQTGSRAASAAPIDGFSEQVASDPVSGIALFGYDAVGYFIEGEAVPGKARLELRWRGTVWRFASHANREAFLREPDVFAPAYGGYDPDGVMRGAAVPPDPTIFLVMDGRLFPFRSLEGRDRYEAEGPEKADAAWPKLRAGLRP